MGPNVLKVCFFSKSKKRRNGTFMCSIVPDAILSSFDKKKHGKNTEKAYFIGINFRDFANFFGVRESLYPRNRVFSGTRESLYPRYITFLGVIEISIKNHQKWRQNKRISPKFHAIAKVYTRKIFERHHSRKFIFSRTLILALDDRESLSPRKFSRLVV